MILEGFLLLMFYPFTSHPVIVLPIHNGFYLSKRWVDGSTLSFEAKFLVCGNVIETMTLTVVKMLGI